VRCILWRGAERALDHGGDLIIINRSRSAWTSLIQEPFDAVLEKAPNLSPSRDGRSRRSAFSSQYQQNPVPVEGLLVQTQWLRFYEPGEEPAKFWFKIQSWDTANKSGELNDFSVCTTWGVIDEHFYLLEVCRNRLNFADLKREVFRQAERHNLDGILVEDKASGPQLIQDGSPPRAKLLIGTAR
jgi:hypothetical protein